MHYVDFFSGSFEDMDIFHVFIYLYVLGRYNPPQCIIFSISFQNTIAVIDLIHFIFIFLVKLFIY